MEGCVSLPVKTALDCLNERASFKKLSSGCENIDHFFSGEIPHNGITEFCGEAGSGKTQMCLQLSLRCALPEKYGGMDSTVFYINTEDSFPDKRLLQLAQNLIRNCNISDLTAVDLLERVKIYPIHTVAQLMESLPSIDEAIGKFHTKLLIVDSVANLFRDVLGQSSIVMERSKAMFELSAALHYFNVNYKMRVIVVNQVSDLFEEDKLINPIRSTTGRNITPLAAATMKHLYAIPTNGKWVRPALGITWDNCVTTRIMMTHPNNTNIRSNIGSDNALDSNQGSTMQDAVTLSTSSTASSSSTRVMYLMFSPSLPTTIIDYVIATDGIEGLGPPRAFAATVTR